MRISNIGYRILNIEVECNANIESVFVPDELRWADKRLRKNTDVLCPKALKGRNTIAQAEGSEGLGRSTYRGHASPERAKQFETGLSSKICRFGILLAVLCVTAGQSFAQYPGYKAVGDLEGFKQKFTAGSEKIQTVASQFTQEKTLVALTEKITSQGKFWFKRSNKVRIEYIKPFTYLMVMNGDKVLLRDGTRENRVNTQSNRLFQQVNRIMIDCMQGTVLNSKDFTARVFEDNGSYLMELTPTGKALKSFFATVVLIVEKSDYSVRSLEMNEAGGDKTTLLFTDKKLNTPVDESVFTF